MGMVLITITPLVGEHRESSRSWGQMTRHESGTFPHRISPDIAQRRFTQCNYSGPLMVASTTSATNARTVENSSPRPQP